MQPPKLTVQQRSSLAAHLFKALVKQHNTGWRPFFEIFIPEDGVVFDVGAHNGHYTKQFARAARRGRVYAFEPSSLTRQIVERVVRWRHLRNVEVVPLALSDVPGEAVLSTPIKKTGAYGIGLARLGPMASDHGAAAERIAVETIDRFCAARGLERLDFIKMDIEGWEARALQGGQEALRRFRPTMIVEILEAHLAHAGSTSADLWSVVQSIGYSGFRISGETGLEPCDEYVGPGDYLFTCAPERVRGFVLPA